MFGMSISTASIPAILLKIDSAMRSIVFCKKGAKELTTRLHAYRDEEDKGGHRIKEPGGYILEMRKNEQRKGGQGGSVKELEGDEEHLVWFQTLC